VFVWKYNWLFDPSPGPGATAPIRIGSPAPLEYANCPGVDQVRVAGVFELTTAIDTQTMFVGLVGGLAVQPVGAVPLFVVKLHDPPVGVAGCDEDTWNTYHSKYDPP
jgi:hypothetical protein